MRAKKFHWQGRREQGVTACFAAQSKPHLPCITLPAHRGERGAGGVGKKRPVRRQRAGEICQRKRGRRSDFSKPQHVFDNGGRERNCNVECGKVAARRPQPREQSGGESQRTTGDRPVYPAQKPNDGEGRAQRRLRDDVGAAGRNLPAKAEGTTTFFRRENSKPRNSKVSS
jgi:hypothetical protein